jgi:gamma-glutamylcyclotransferase (GGCT)/AIG2-like uncharacterized protein YtfP
MEDSQDYIFVYGTLRDASVNHKAFYLKSNATFVGKGTIQAKLYKVNWYPAMVLSNNEQDVVHGEIYKIKLDYLEMVLHELDGYEGIYTSNEESEEYERIETLVSLEDGIKIKCWVYNYKADVSKALRIVSGDYLDFLATQRN